MWRGIDKVGKRYQGCRETDGGAIERRNEDFRMSIEGICDLKVACNKGSKGFTTEVGAFGEVAREGNIGTTMTEKIVSKLCVSHAESCMPTCM